MTKSYIEEHIETAENTKDKKYAETQLIIAKSMLEDTQKRIKILETKQ